MIRRATKALLRGRRIVDVNLNRFSDGRGGWTHDPAILLDDGSLLKFDVRETDAGGRYGVEPVLYTPDRPGERTPESVSTQEPQGLKGGTDGG